MSKINFKFCIPSVDWQNDAADSIDRLTSNDIDYNVIITPLSYNKRPLPELYNECIDAALADDVDWLVLCHNDLVVESNNLLDRIIEPGYDIVGLAGASNVKITSPALWHLMALPNTMRGAVAHHAPNNTKQVSSFGIYPARCVIMDGLFLAIHRRVFEKIRFDETNPAGFHFYDLDYTLECHNAGFKIGVGDILVTHQSPGLKQITPEWSAGERWFINKHNK